jgi:Na+/H+ antiporter NhaD/arsenite permease-like protein
VLGVRSGFSALLFAWLLVAGPLFPGQSSAADDVARPHGNAAAHQAAGEQQHGQMGRKLPLISVLPFVALLLCIAILPLVAGHWWEHNSNKAIVAGFLAAVIAIYLVAAWGQAGWHELLDKLREYTSFMILLTALYVISGGIYIKGSLSGTPLANTSLLAIGAALASFIGTTGASVLLIRPLLRANKTRVAKAHIVVFFIFTVSNCGGLLTPLGDPPLFLGFLKGVPFLWTAQHLWMHWIVVNLLLLIVFQIYDQIVFDREERERPGSQLEEVMRHEPLRIDGLFNFLLLGGVIAAIYCSGQYHWPFGIQEVLMAALAAVSYFATPAANHAANRFTFGPIIEVAVLFIGIFITMAPALLILNAWGQDLRPDLGPFAIDTAWKYFWAAGALSSFLDNAPTYLTFAATAAGKKGVEVGGASYLLQFLNQGGPDARLWLAAISCGAVFMGANTYIGNGPNFMVKAIAEENGVQMPSFFGYMAWSCGILLPLFLLVSLLFYAGA